MDDKKKSVCDDCDHGDEWSCMFCCARCKELYGPCPNEECDPMDLCEEDADGQD